MRLEVVVVTTENEELVNSAPNARNFQHDDKNLPPNVEQFLERSYGGNMHDWMNANRNFTNCRQRHNIQSTRVVVDDPTS